VGNISHVFSIQLYFRNLKIGSDIAWGVGRQVPVPAHHKFKLELLIKKRHLNFCLHQRLFHSPYPIVKSLPTVGSVKTASHWGSFAASKWRSPYSSPEIWPAAAVNSWSSSDQSFQFIFQYSSDSVSRFWKPVQDDFPSRPGLHGTCHIPCSASPRQRPFSGIFHTTSCLQM
jgi:hypothetical protein